MEWNRKTFSSKKAGVLVLLLLTDSKTVPLGCTVTFGFTGQLTLPPVPVDDWGPTVSR